MLAKYCPVTYLIEKFKQEMQELKYEKVIRLKFRARNNGEKYFHFPLFKNTFH